MRVLKGTLTFVLGIIMGIVLFVGAIAGTIYAVATSFTIGDITQKVGLTGDKAIFDEGSDITNKTIWEVGQDLIGDVQNIGNMTLNELAEKYGLSKKVGGLGEISGIDISPLFDIPINQLKDNLGVIVDNITLQDIGEFAGMDFSSYGLPVLDENLHNPVTVALDSILKSIDGDNISLRLIEDNFGITLGDNAIFNQIKDAPLSSFGDIINDLEVGAVIDADCDLFVKRGDNTLYVKSERYEVVPSDEFNTIKDGATTYVYGQSEDGLLKRELRFVAKTTKDADGNSVPLLDENGNPVYRVDNSCYGEEVDTEKTFYRFYEYEVYNPEMPVVGALYLRAYGNHMVESEGTFVPVEDGYVALANLASDETGAIISFTGNTVNLTSVYTNLITPETWTLAENYGINTEYELTKDSRLESGFDGYFRVKVGASDVAIQAIAYTTVSGLNNATDALMSLKLCDLIEVDDESSQILKTLKDKPLNKLSDSIDDLLLGDVVEITFSLYKESDNGDYVYVTGEDGSYYTLYNPQEHAGYQRYTKVVTGETELPDYVVATETDLADSTIIKYYWDGTSMVAGSPDGQQLYVKGNASSKILQRLASLSIGDFSTAFDALILGDVIDVDMDLYEELPTNYFDLYTASPFDEFYVFDGTKYVPTDTPETDLANNIAVYTLVEESESSTILKKLALVKVDALSEEMNNLIDTMRLDEVMDINTAHYEPTADGSYVYVKAGGYFTLYNPAIHTDSQRYTKVVTGDDAKPDYLKATETDLADSTIIKYYWDGTQMVAGTPADTPLYVKGNASNKILQRLARVEINDFSSAIDSLALSDVIDIDADEYRVALQSEVDADVTGETIFYVYDNGLFLEADAAERADSTIAKYAVASLGTSHVVMKKMAYLPVTELGNRMNDVVGDLYLKDLVDIYEFDVITDDDVANRGTEGYYFVPYDEDYTEYDEDGAHRFSFVRDSNGKYYLRNTMYFALTDAQADAFKLPGEGNTISFNYVQLTDANIDELKPLIMAGNGYFKEASDTEYHYNPALCSYIANNEDTSNYPNVYVRKDGSDHKLPIYDNSTGMLYVKMFGVPVPYDSTSEVHADLEKFILLSEGFAPVEDNVNDTRTKFYLGKDGIFRQTTDNIYTGISFIQNTVKHQDGSIKYYYYAPVDSEYNALVKYAREHGTPEPPTFSKQLATTIYSQTDEALATKAFYDKQIIDVSLVPEGASGVEYVKEEIGHIMDITGSNAEVQSYLDLMHEDTRKVVHIQQQSAAALKAFSVHNVKVSSLDSELKNFKVCDMIDIAPDSLFDDDEIKNSTIDDLSGAFQEKLQKMTIQNILDWGNITTLDPEVLTIIGDATLEDFFDSLSYTPANGIHVDIVTLYKNIYGTNESGTV